MAESSAVPQTIVAAAKPDLTVGEILSTTFSVWSSNLGPLLAISFIAFAPLLLDQLVFGTTVSGLHAGVRAVAGVALRYFITGAIVEEVREAMRGESIDLQAGLNVGASRFFAVLFVSIVYGFGIVVGMVLLIVPGMILLAMWSVAVPVTVSEKLGVMDSLSRSSALTRGARGTVFGAFVVLGLIVIVVAGVPSYFLRFAGNPGAIAVLCAQAAGGSLSAVLPAVIYFKLVAAKEAPKSQELAQVFA